MTLLDLAARCESATGPDREIDRDILHCLWNGPARELWMHCAGKSPPFFTTSIDAALMLVPEGWAWMAGCAAGETFFATLSPTDESGIEADMIDTNAATPALALCAAALRARAQIEGQEA